MLHELKEIPRLVIKTEPPEIWYKDIGGKKDTFMSLQVVLEGQAAADLQWELHLDLFFEDRKRVEDKFQSILKTQHNQSSPPIVNARNRSVKFLFRIEKVSKNFMGQKFRVRCYAKPRPPPGFEGVAPNLASPELNVVYSRPIESRSKLPSAGRARSRSPAPRKRHRTSGSSGDHENMDKIVVELRKTQEKLATTQSALSKMVLVLQQCVTRLGAVEAATERSGSSESKGYEEADTAAKPPPLKRQRSKTKTVFRTEDNQQAFFNVMDDTEQPMSENKLGQMTIPPLLRQFSQEFRDSKGDYPVLEPENGILPHRIASGDLNFFLQNLAANNANRGSNGSVGGGR